MLSTRRIPLPLPPQQLLALATTRRGLKKGVDVSGRGNVAPLKWARHHALNCTTKYIKSLQDAPPVVPKHPESDPALMKDNNSTRMKHVFRHPELNEQVQRDPHSHLGDLKELSKILTPEYSGMQATVPFGPFGTVTLSHGDVLDHECDALLVPMVPNFLPYRGFGLKVLEFGGPPLVKEAFSG